MWINNIKLNKFRNYDSREIKLNENINNGDDFVIKEKGRRK